MALEKIGPYKFQGILGRGGMGTVYRGRHEETGELHAVKILAPTYAHDAHFRGRFESEIKALIKLDHENIVRLLSYGQEDGMLYFSMELVEGNSLFQMQKKGHRFDWLEIIAIFRDVAKGLRHAHDRGVIHRDLKPGNLLMMVDEDGKPSHVKITDFGIAKRFGSNQNTGHNVLGTMDFMSPEQAKGEPVTIRSDLYSLGTVLFTLLSGRPPFSANSVEESLRNLTRVPAPRISTIVPNVPKELDDLIRRLMSKKPENRIQTAQALLHQIDEVETKLKNHSEAQTTYKDHKKSDETFDIRTPRTIANTEMDSAGTIANKTNVEEVGPTIDSYDPAALEEPLTVAAKVDYYNPVTETLRKRQAELEEFEPEKSGGVFPLILALIAVLLLGSYGVYQAYAPPSAEALFSKIEENSEFPNRASEDIDLFLKHYPDEPRAEKVAELRRIAEAIDLYNGLSNTLSVRRNLPGENRLTPVEKLFLSFVDLAQDNPVQADAKMKSFITAHERMEDLSAGDRKCVDAARSYRIKLEYDAKNKVLLNLNLVRSAMKTAEKTIDPDEAIPIYQSIVELYGKVDWGQGRDANEGRQLIQDAQRMIIVMEQAKIRVAQEKAAEDAERKARQEAADSESEKGSQDRPTP